MVALREQPDSWNCERVAQWLRENEFDEYADLIAFTHKVKRAGGGARAEIRKAVSEKVGGFLFQPEPLTIMRIAIIITSGFDEDSTHGRDFYSHTK
jgi:hypothetical protein